MCAERVELHLGAGGVACGGEGVLDVEVAVAVVAVGTDEHHAIFGQAVDEDVAQRGAVRGAPLRQPPAVVDDQTLVVCLRHVLHPSKRIQRRRLVHHQRSQEQFGCRGHAGEPDSSASARRDASHVGPMGGVAVHVGRVAAQELDFPRLERGDPVVEALRRLSGSAVLVPNPRFGMRSRPCRRTWGGCSRSPSRGPRQGPLRRETRGRPIRRARCPPVCRTALCPGQAPPATPIPPGPWARWPAGPGDSRPHGTRPRRDGSPRKDSLWAWAQVRQQWATCRRPTAQ